MNLREQRRTLGFFIFALLVGCALRLAWPTDIEFKQDEQYMFDRAARVGISEPWPALGVSSGVHLRNPGMSVWAFVVLGRGMQFVSGGTLTPVLLTQGVMLLNCVALALLLVFAWRLPQTGSLARDRLSWLWGGALAAVNPLAVMFHRKIWAQSILPFFCVLFLMAWWKRHRPAPAFAWGLIGACLGQIHMSGFFFAAAFAAWTWGCELQERHRARTGIPSSFISPAHWRSWFAGSTLGAFCLLPWIQHLWEHLHRSTTAAGANASKPMVFGLQEALQLKYWVFWLTDPFGLHLGNLLGVENGNSIPAQLGEFLRYPLYGTQSSWLMGIAHGGVVGILALTLILLAVVAFHALRARLGRGRTDLVPTTSPTSIAISAVLWGYGGLLTASTVLVRRYYLLITFPLEFVWLSRVIIRGLPLAAARVILRALFWLLLVISVGCLAYVRSHGGALQGDFGPSYRMQHP